ncbi:hypothetical protein [Amycolatopsis sp. NPDC004079]|uniref:hypothetical protein n=1 Tax=Amycolatopsis sp. NPDC004079 TaxID=3154549 RepID=UPI0033A08FAF
MPLLINRADFANPQLRAQAVVRPGPDRAVPHRNLHDGGGDDHQRRRGRGFLQDGKAPTTVTVRANNQGVSTLCFVRNPDKLTGVTLA